MAKKKPIRVTTRNPIIHTDVHLNHVALFTRKGLVKKPNIGQAMHVEELENVTA